MTPPPPSDTSSLPTMRVSVELVFVRCCVECRGIAERASIAAISDPSVTVFRLIPGKRHAHEIDESNAPIGDQPQTDRLFDAIPHSDTNGFDPKGRPE